MSKLKSKVVTINDRRTSIRLCRSEWDALDDICKKEKLPRKKLIEILDHTKNAQLGLTGSIRLFSIAYYHSMAKQKKASANQIIDKLFYQ